MKRSLPAAVSLFVLMTCVARVAMAGGDNLVPNGNFDSDLHNWTIESSSNFGTAEWSADQADHTVHSGSAVVHARGLGTTELRSACVPIEGGVDYLTGTAYKAYWGGGAYTALWIRLVWWGDSACGSNTLREDLLAFTRDTGNHWLVTSRIVSAPADAVSAEVRLQVRGDFYSPRTSVSGQFDSVVLAPIVCGGGCGDPLPDAGPSSGTEGALVTASDALYILHAAVGEETCTPCICDVNDSGNVSATDALLTLAASIGGPVTLTCPL